MRTIILAATLAILSGATGCKLLCRDCHSHYTPALPAATGEPSRLG